MNPLAALRARLRRYPSFDDAEAVRRMTSEQWRTIAQRTPTYLEGYRDRPGSDDRAQRRANWIAEHVACAAPLSLAELGCGCGRNLAAVRRRLSGPPSWAFPRLLIGIDISAEAIKEARSVLPGAVLIGADALSIAVLPEADVVLTCGFLDHVPPIDLPGLLHRMLAAARQRLVMVEEPGHGELAKGPRSCGAEKETGDYLLWCHDFDRVLTALGHQAKHVPLPEDLRAPAATEMLVVETA
jgi:hypothetical protein